MGTAMFVKRQSEGYLPEISYTGTTSGVVDEGNKNWHIILEGAGANTLKFLKRGNANRGVDVCVVGGGGSGGKGINGRSGYRNEYGHGGGGGGAGNITNDMTGTIIPASGTNYTITIGEGGAAITSTVGTAGNTGGTTSAFGVTATGGTGGAADKDTGQSDRNSGGTGTGGNGGDGGVRRYTNSGSGDNNQASEQGYPQAAPLHYAFDDSEMGIAIGGGGGGGGATGGNTSGYLQNAGSAGGLPYGGHGGDSTSGGYNSNASAGEKYGAGGGGCNGLRSSGAGAAGVVIIRNHRA